MVGPPQSSARFASSIALAQLFALFTQYSLRASSPIWASEAVYPRDTAPSKKKKQIQRKAWMDKTEEDDNGPQ